MHRPASVDVVASLFAATATKAGLFVFLPLMFSGLSWGQPQQRWNIAAGGTYTTSVRLLSADGSRTKIFGLNYGAGVELRWQPSWSDVQFGIAADRMQVSASYPYMVRSGGGVVSVPAEEGYEFFSIALSGLFVFPFSTDAVQVYAGGGGGFYWGRRKSTIAGVEQALQNEPTGAGIHALLGADFRVWSGFCFRSEIKFRDPQFDSENVFPQAEVYCNGVRILLPTIPERTTVNLNGVMYGIGFVAEL